MTSIPHFPNPNQIPLPKPKFNHNPVPKRNQSLNENINLIRLMKATRTFVQSNFKRVELMAQVPHERNYVLVTYDG